MRELLRHRDFRLLLAGQTLSMFGDWTLLLVFGMWGKSLTGSNAVAGMMVFAMAAPGLLAPLGGLLADRVRRRTLMVVLDLLSAGVVLLLWAVHDSSDVWLLFAVAAWSGLTSVVFGAAMSGLVQGMLPADLVGPANGALATVRQALRLLGPLVGAGLFAAAGGRWVATLDAATFLGSAAVLLALRQAEPRHPRERVAFRTEVAAGVRHLLGEPLLRRVLWATVLCVAGLGLTEAGIYALVDDGLHRPVTFLGVVASVQGAGAVVGGVVVTAVVRRVREITLFCAGLVLSTVGAVGAAVPSLPVVLVAVAVFGASLPAINVAAGTLLQHATPNRLMGRVAAAYDLGNALPYLTFVAVGAAVVGSVPYSWLMLLAALGCALGLAYAAPGIRRPDPPRADLLAATPSGGAPTGP